jgi:anti-sigma B factor antagonist
MAPRIVRDLDGTALEAGDFRLEEDEPRPGAVVISVHGDLDLHSADQLAEMLVIVVDRGPSLLVIDLSDVEFVDSQGLGALLRGTRRFGADKERFRLVVPAREIRRVFEITALDQVFPLDESREVAIAAGSSASAADGASA